MNWHKFSLLSKIVAAAIDCCLPMIPPQSPVPFATVLDAELDLLPRCRYSMDCCEPCEADERLCRFHLRAHQLLAMLMIMWRFSTQFNFSLQTATELALVRRVAALLRDFAASLRVLIDCEYVSLAKGADGTSYTALPSKISLCPSDSTRFIVDDTIDRGFQGVADFTPWFSDYASPVKFNGGFDCRTDLCTGAFHMYVHSPRLIMHLRSQCLLARSYSIGQSME